MKSSVYIFLFLFLISSKSYSQDTLLLDNQIKYYSESDSVDILSFYAKNIYYRADYSRELIKFDNDSAKLEYCFYYDNERIFHENKIYSDTPDYIILLAWNFADEIMNKNASLRKKGVKFILPHEDFRIA